LAEVTIERIAKSASSNRARMQRRSELFLSILVTYAKA